jgi:Ca2+-binding EF-hand superfamily protein
MMKSIPSNLFPLLLTMLVWPFAGGHLYSQADIKADLSPMNASELLSRMDADQDGFITQQEWNRLFCDQDKNGDKRLSPEELHSIRFKSGGEAENQSADPDIGRLEAFKRLDVNGNDAIDPSEWPGKDKDFLYLDADRDKRLSRIEFLSRNGRYWNLPFENLDFNEDGIISKSEWLDSDESFNRLDRNQNGVIERREFYNRL